jgi:hypothetical protein
LWTPPCPGTEPVIPFGPGPRNWPGPEHEFGRGPGPGIIY